MAPGDKAARDNDSKALPSDYGSNTPIVSPTVRAFDKKAKSYLKAFQRSFSSSALDRNSPMVADEDTSAMTIDFLWTRLQAQRSLYKAEKQRVQALVQKILDLEHRLNMEVELRKQAERGIIVASTLPDNKIIGSHHTFLGKVGVEASPKHRCKGSYSSSSSSTEVFCGHANDVYTDGDEGGVFRGHPFPQDDDHCGGCGHLNIEGKNSLQGPDLHSHRHPYSCLGKEKCPEVTSTDLDGTRQMQGCVAEQGCCLCAVGSVQHGMDIGAVEDLKEQGEVDQPLQVSEHHKILTSFQCQGSDLPGEARKVFNRSSLTPETTSVKDVQWSLEHVNDRKEICEMVNESTLDCVQKGYPQVPYATVEDICRRSCPSDDDTRALIRFPRIPSDKSKLPCQEGELDTALGRQERPRIGSSHAMNLSGFSNGMPSMYKFECNNMDSRRVMARQGSTPKRKELGHSLSLGRVVVPSEYSTCTPKRRELGHSLSMGRVVAPSEYATLEWDPEPVYSMTEVLRMLELTKHICASNRTPRLKPIDKDQTLVTNSHCPRSLRRSQSSRFLPDTNETKGAL